MQQKVTEKRQFNSTKAENNNSISDLLVDDMAALKEFRKTLVRLFDEAELKVTETAGHSRIDQLKMDISEYLLSAMSESQRNSFLKERGKIPDSNLREMNSLDASIEETLNSFKRGDALSLTSDSKLPPCKQKSAKDNRATWTQEEHKKFLEALEMYGKNWAKVTEHVGTRNRSQIGSHAQAHFKKLAKKDN